MFLWKLIFVENVSVRSILRCYIHVPTNITVHHLLWARVYTELPVGALLFNLSISPGGSEELWDEHHIWGKKIIKKSPKFLNSQIPQRFKMV